MEAHTVTGQLTFRRAISKKLVFYDLLCSGSEQGGEPSWVEVVVKLGTYGSIEEVKDLRDRLKLGDVVAATGRFLPARRELQAAAVAVLAPWRDSHPGQSFTPRPAPPHAAAEPPQPAAAEQQQRSADSNSPQKQQAGADLAPVPEGPQGTTAAAAAAAAAAAGAVRRPSAQRQVCKYFVNSGRCAKGASCPFAHEHTGALRQRWLADMLGERQALAAQRGFAHVGGAAAKRRRAQVFAAWLVETFGKDALNAGEGVLDVAGGAGSVTFELSHVHGVQCTLVEPRPLKLNKWQLRQLQAAWRAAAVHTTTAAQLQQGPEHPAPPAAPGGAQLALAQVQALFGPELWRSGGWRRRFARGFSLVLACHPDQATDAALDFALEARLPFAIVPCCVFARLFPHRRLAAGGGGTGEAAAVPAPVTTYPELVAYLAARGRAQQAVLPFEGANIVVYRRRPEERQDSWQPAERQPQQAHEARPPAPAAEAAA